jgi:hypothetical protein
MNKWARRATLFQKIKKDNRAGSIGGAPKWAPQAHCTRHDKAIWTNKTRARAAIHHYCHTGMRPYECGLIPGWHIGHNPPAVLRGEKTADEVYKRGAYATTRSQDSRPVLTAAEAMRGMWAGHGHRHGVVDEHASDVRADGYGATGVPGAGR